MDTIKLLVFYWSVMLLCYFAASRLRAHADRFAFLDKVLTGIITVMVFIMGLKMGADEEVISSLGTIGLQAALITAVSVGGSILFVMISRKILHLDRYGMPEGTIQPENSSAERESYESGAAESPSRSSEMTMTLMILGFVAAGMICGYAAVPKLFAGNMEGFQSACGNLMTAGITLLLGIIGFTMGLTGEIVEHLKHVGPSVIIIPLMAIAGSLAGGALYGAVSSLTVREGIAVSAGFGWYTLAPGLITEAGHTVAGAVSFMHNVIREVLGIIGIPLFARYFGYLECTAVPGVAAMDVCMPIVEKSTRQETVVYSFMTGLFMCLAVPIAVPLMIS